MKIKLVKEPDKKNSIAETIFINRGIEKDKIEEFLHTTDESILGFEDLDNIDNAESCLVNHYKIKSEILIQVDCDVDGYTSAAILYNYLKTNYPGIRLNYQVHDDKTHGLDVTKDILNEVYSLIIVPDAGSNEYETHKQLNQLGIDIIILDHHECPYESPDAIVVNNQLSKFYSNKTLSGAGVTWKLLKKLDLENEFNCHMKKAEDYLDLVALALIADMSDLRNLETKRLIEKGLEHINNKYPRNNRFLSYMVEKNSFSLGNEVTPIGLAFYIAPMINAVVRVGTMPERILAFEAFLDDIGSKIIPSTKRGCKGQTETTIEQAARTLTNVKNRQKKNRDEAFVNLEKQITEESLTSNPIILLNTKGLLDKNLNGLVANQVMSKYQRPVFVGSFSKDQEKEFFRGSARAPDSGQLKDFRNFIEESGFADYASGHASAFGVSFSRENLDLFLAHAKRAISLSNLESEYLVDFLFNTEDLRDTILLEIGNLKDFWGQGIKEPLIAVQKARVDFDKKTLMSADKNPTLKLTINGISCIKFKSSQDEFNLIAPNQYTSTLINFVGKCNVNEWMGNISPQILIEDYEIISNIVSF